MHYLIYISTSIKLMDDAQLESLLQTCRLNNQKLNVTGMLLYKSGNFMQMLEGDKTTIFNLLNHIKKDSRHKDIYKIMDGEINQRSFNDWSMGFYNMQISDSRTEYSKYFDNTFTLKTFADDEQAAYNFIRNFNERNQ